MPPPIDYPSGCFDRCAAFERKLEGYTKQICSNQWQQTFQEISDDTGLHISDICKTLQAVNRVVGRLCGGGTEFPMFEKIIEKVDELERGSEQLSMLEISDISDAHLRKIYGALTAL